MKRKIPNLVSSLSTLLLQYYFKVISISNKLEHVPFLLRSGLLKMSQMKRRDVLTRLRITRRSRGILLFSDRNTLFRLRAESLDAVCYCVESAMCSFSEFRRDCPKKIKSYNCIFQNSIINGQIDTLNSGMLYG